jgi:serine/threonine protein phosphatase PrpC
MLEHFGLSDVGRRRPHNEDTIVLDAEASFFAVCDGLGGQNAGEVASKLAAETLQAFIDKSHRDKDITWPYGLTMELSFDGNRLFTAVGLANKKVFRAADGRPDYTGMGTTVVAGLVRESVLTIAWVGDSRAYLIRNGSILRLTQDHNWKAMAVKNGVLTPEEAEKPHQYDNVLVKAVGGKPDVEPDIVEKRLEPGDMILLCSDGLTPTMLKKDEDVLRLLTPPPASLEAAVKNLIAAANDAGGKDNVSVILVKYTTGEK